MTEPTHRRGSPERVWRRGLLPWAFVAASPCLLTAIACSLNPQPLPPDTADSASGFYNQDSGKGTSEPDAGADAGGGGGEAGEGDATVPAVDGALDALEGSTGIDGAVLDGEAGSSDGSGDAPEDAPGDSPGDSPHDAPVDG